MTIDWQAASAVATGLGAVVTAATAVFIAKQTGATRRAAEAGERTASTAVDALELAQAEARRGEFLALETVRSRIDSGVPQLRVVVDEGSVPWPPLAPPTYGGDPQPWELGQQFALPRQSAIAITLRVFLRIYNEGPHTASLQFGHPIQIPSVFPETLGPPVTEATLEEGATLRCAIDITKSVSEWVRIYRERDRTRGPVDPLLMSITQVASTDTGADETTIVEIDGTLLRPVADHEGEWTFVDRPVRPFSGVGAIGWSVHPSTRRYFLSKSRGITLPDAVLPVTDHTGV
jgi:hypothetical protein